MLKISRDDLTKPRDFHLVTQLSRTRISPDNYQREYLFNRDIVIVSYKNI